MLTSQQSDFLMHYQQDLPYRWTREDLAAQETFVGDAMGEGDWMDWSTPEASLELLQSVLLEVSLGMPAADQIVLAGPVAELVEPGTLFRMAAGRLNPGGRLIGIVPCLRDNSPESTLFQEVCRERLWPYATAEELGELLEEAGLTPRQADFAPIEQMKAAVLADAPAFKGFREVFNVLESQGYDPMEVGWGELRLVASAAG